MPERGYYDMACWNGLSAEQQRMLLDDGVLHVGHWKPAGGPCSNGAELAIETMYDRAPGPRFYCRPCAIKFLAAELSATPLDIWRLVREGVQ